MVALGLLLSFVLTGMIAGFGSQYVRAGGPTVAFLANVAVLAIGAIVCLFRSTRWRSLGMGLMIGWAGQVIVLGVCAALLSQAEFG